MIYILNSLCEDDAGFQIFGFLGQILNIIKILIPIIIVIMGSIDLVKAIMAGKEDELKKGYSTLIKRLIIGVIIFFVPGIVGLIIDLAGGTKECESAKCVFKDSAECISQKSNITLNKNKFEGQTIIINGESYVLKEGDTVDSVAKKFGVDSDEIKSKMSEIINGNCSGFLFNGKCFADENLYR